MWACSSNDCFEPCVVFVEHMVSDILNVLVCLNKIMPTKMTVGTLQPFHGVGEQTHLVMVFTSQTPVVLGNASVHRSV